MSLANRLRLFRVDAPPADPPSADGSSAVINSPLALSPLSGTSPDSNSPGSGDRTESFQRPVEGPGAPHVAAATAPATLAQLEKLELDDKEADFTRRGAVRSLGRYYARELGYRSMARLRAEVEADRDVQDRFEALLKEDGVDWKSWDAMTQWYDTKKYEYAQEHGQLGRPVGVSLEGFVKVNDAWFKRCCDPILMTFYDSDESK